MKLKISASIFSGIVVLGMAVTPVFAASNSTHTTHHKTVKTTSVNPTTTAKHLSNVINEVKPYVKTHLNGTDSVKVKKLKDLGLTNKDIKFVTSQIKHYNKLIKQNKVNPYTHLSPNVSKSLSATATSTNPGSITVSPMSTEGLPHWWFVANYPAEITYDYWWGHNSVYNELGTQHLEGALGMVAGGATVGIAATAWVPFLDAGTVPLFTAIAGATGFTVGYFIYRDNGYGDTIKYTGSVPWYAYGNAA